MHPDHGWPGEVEQAACKCAGLEETVIREFCQPRHYTLVGLGFGPQKVKECLKGRDRRGCGGRHLTAPPEIEVALFDCLTNLLGLYISEIRKNGCEDISEFARDINM